jgi:hypothetical protein
MIDTLWQSIFQSKVAAYDLDAMEEQDIRTAVLHQMHLRLRPAKPSDALGAAYSAMTLIEGIYDRIAADTTDEWKRLTEEIRSAEGPTPGEVCDPGRGTR